METNVMWWLLAGLVALALVLGAVVRATQTRVRTAADATDAISPEVFAAPGLGAPEFGERLTLVQFSTTTCARCPSTARSLRRASDAHAGVRHVEVDVTTRDDLIARFAIRRTPTVLILDADGRLRARASGPVTTEHANELVEAHLGSSDATLGELQPVLSAHGAQS